MANKYDCMRCAGVDTCEECGLCDIEHAINEMLEDHPTDYNITDEQRQEMIDIHNEATL